MRISLASVFVDDPEEAFKFYTEILGFVERLHIPGARLAIVASHEDPLGTGLLLDPSENPVAKAYQEGLYTLGLPAIVLAVEDMEAEYERLKALGVTFRKGPTMQEWGIEALLDDTCGNLVQLHQP